MYPNVQRYVPSKTLCEPAFLRERVDTFYEERVRKNWNGKHICSGVLPGDGAILLMSNDYLSLAEHPHILQAQSEAMLDSGNGLIMSAVFLKEGTPHEALEAQFAALLQAESAVLCQSGWCANTGLIQSIADERVPVYIDLKAHASFWEGIHSAGATAYPFRHNDAEHLESLIRRHGSGIVAVDSVYSTNGSLCPLREIVEIGERYNCVLVVDESHSFGSHGEQGEGLVASLGLAEKVHFRTASLAKAFAARAGLITCSKEFVLYFRCTSRPALFSSTLLPHELAGLAATLDVVRNESWRRQRLHRNAEVLRKGLLELGYNVTDSGSQIIGLESGPEPQTIVLRDALESRGVFGSVFAAPATTASRALVRFSVNTQLSDAELARILAVCAEIRDEVGLADWPSTRRLQRRLKKAA